MQNDNDVKRCCLFCGSELKGRLDKKFCDDLCRNNYHYNQNKHNDIILNTINKSLKHNRKILQKLCARGRKIVKKQILIDNKFDFELITGIHKTVKKKEYYLVYDYAYRCLNDYDVLLLKYYC